MSEHEFAVILAGGSGERFWPLSTRERPKQFISIFGGKPLLSLAVERLRGLIPPERIIIITASRLLEATRACAPAVPPENIVGEPCARDTAAACALAGALVESRDRQGVFGILTADHLMQDEECFRKTLATALGLAARREVLVTIGIPPTRPSTGYGYIHAVEPLDGEDGTILRARRFVEKPDEQTAQLYLADGNYYWNGGMFIWNVRAFRSALFEHCPQLSALYRTVLDSDPAEMEQVLAATYPALSKISIDYALMEKAGNIVVLPGDFGWDDVGSWPAMASHFKPDAAGNVEIGACETIDSSDNIIVSETRLTALIGVQDLIVVQAGQATLICPRERAQEVKALVAHLARRPDAEKYL